MNYPYLGTCSVYIQLFEIRVVVLLLLLLLIKCPNKSSHLLYCTHTSLFTSLNVWHRRVIYTQLSLRKRNRETTPKKELCFPLRRETAFYEILRVENQVAFRVRSLRTSTLCVRLATRLIVIRGHAPGRGQLSPVDQDPNQRKSETWPTRPITVSVDLICEGYPDVTVKGKCSQRLRNSYSWTSRLLSSRSRTSTSKVYHYRRLEKLLTEKKEKRGKTKKKKKKK